jgi:hypothetical protein
MNRRKFLRHTGAAIAAGVIAPAAFTLDSARVGSAKTAGAPRITAVVFDERYSDSRVFADTLVEVGARPFAISGNSAELWYGLLRDHIRSSPGQIAGLTTESDRGVSLACGRELRLRPICEGVHDARRSSAIVHRIHVPVDRDEIVVAVRASRPLWPESLALALYRIKFRTAHSARFRTPIAAANAPAIATTPLSRDFPGYLTSWLLAPAELA